MKSLFLSIRNVSIQNKTRIILYAILFSFIFAWISGIMMVFGLKNQQNLNNTAHILTFIQVSILDDKKNILKAWNIYKENNEKNHRNWTIKGRDVFIRILMSEKYEELLNLYQKSEQINKEIDKVLNKYKKLNSSSKMSLTSRLSDTKILQDAMQNLIKINLNIIFINNQISKMIYFINLIVFTSFMMMLGLLLFLSSQSVMKSIIGEYSILENLVAQRTQKLQDLNNQLQKSIEYEVNLNRQKDIFIYQQARLASMGEMIHNIAHQWRQPLNVLILLIQSFRTKFDHGKLTQKFIYSQCAHGLKVAKQMSNTIEDFSNFFMPNTSKSEFLVHKKIKDSLNLIKSIIRDANIKIIIEIDENLKITGYESAFTQVIFILLNNAIDALNKKEQKHKSISIRQSLEDNTLFINVEDNGGGIEQGSLDKIFEPYFTTKKHSNTGIGLYMARQIIEKQFNGKISVENVESSFEDVMYKGCVFTLSIPMCDSISIDKILT